MSRTTTAMVTKGYTITVDAAQILPYNLHRKALLLAPTTNNVEIAFGESPGPEDYFTLYNTRPFMFDSVVPAQPMWAKGAGVLVVGEDQ